MSTPSPQPPPEPSRDDEDPIERLKRELPGFPEIPRQRTSPPPNQTMTGAAKAIALSTNFIVIALAGGGLGYLLDRWLGWLPWGTIAGFFIGLIGGTVRIVRDMMAEDRGNPPPRS